MSSTWYVGLSNVRSISAARWAELGAGVVATTTWDRTNGYSIANTTLNAAQLVILNRSDEFNTSAADTPRTEPIPPISVVVTESRLAEALGAAAVSTVALAARPSTQLRALMAAMNSGRSTAFGWHGDSTGDSDGTLPADRRTPENFARQLAAKFPAYHVMMRKWNAGAERFDAPVVLQAAAAGQAYAQFNGRSMRYPSKLFTTSNLDIRVKVDLTGATAGGVLVCQIEGDATVYNTQRVFSFQTDSGRLLQVFASTDGVQKSLGSSTVALPVDYIGWVRTTYETTIGDATTGSLTYKFWTSPDGIVWTQLGATKGPFVGVRAAVWQSTQADFEIGASGWQPAASALKAKIYEVEIRDGIDGVLLAPTLPYLWERFSDTSTTFGGAPTLYVVNASASGKNLVYYLDTVRGPRLAPNYGQVVSFFNDSHNEGGLSGPRGWLAPYLQWVNLVLGRMPLSTAVAVLQTPHTSAWSNELAYGASHPMRITELSAYAALQNWGTLDLYGAFFNDSRGLSALVGPDGLHLTQTGYLFAGLTVGKLAGITS